MGEQFQRKRAKGFKHHQVIDHERELEQQTLLTERPEIYSREYSCEIRSPERPTELILALRGGEVVVLEGNADVGRVVLADADRLPDAIEAAGGLLAVEVLDFSSLTGATTIAVKKAAK
jgi:hypothetical protein